MLDTEHKIDEQEDTASAVGSPHLNSGTPAKREEIQLQTSQTVKTF